MTYKVDIISPKAEKLLKNLADLNLITLTASDKDGFLQTLKKLRKKTVANPISIETITKEVELVRAKRYANKNKA